MRTRRSASTSRTSTRLRRPASRAVGPTAPTTPVGPCSATRWRRSSPAWRTRSWRTVWRGRRPRRLARVSAGPDDGLELGVRVEAEGAAVAAHAGLLEPAERGLVVALRGVDADVAGSQLLRHPHGAGRVRGEHVVVQPELGAVGEGHAFVLVVERNHDHHRSEDLL